MSGVLFLMLCEASSHSCLMLTKAENHIKPFRVFSVIVNNIQGQGPTQSFGSTLDQG